LFFLLISFDFDSIHIAETSPTINITSAVDIPLPYNDTNRNYSLPISINGATSTLVTISQNGTIQSSIFNGLSITIPIPNDANSYVDVL